MVAIDYFVLFAPPNGLALRRIVSDRFSSGDENKVELSIKNNYRFPVSLVVIDEMPIQYQRRNFK